MLPRKGTHVAILFAGIDWGTQQDKFGSRRKVELLWELPEETFVFDEDKGEQPLIVDRKYARTVSKNADLRDILEQMTGEELPKEVNLEDYMGEVHLLAIKIVRNGDYDNVEIVSASPATKDVRAAKFEPTVKPYVIDLDPDKFNEKLWNKMIPDWKKVKIAKSPEFKKLVAEGLAEMPAGVQADDGQDDRRPSGRTSSTSRRSRNDEEDERPAARNRRSRDDDEDETPRNRRRPADDDEDERPSGRHSRSRDDDEDDRKPARGKFKERGGDEEEDERPSRRGSRKPQEEEEERPAARRGKAPKDEDDDLPFDKPAPRKSRRDDDEEEERPRSRSRSRDDDEEDERPRSRNRR